MWCGSPGVFELCQFGAWGDGWSSTVIPYLGAALGKAEPFGDHESLNGLG